MSQIDFLPENYRQRDVHRKIRWSRVVVVVLFVSLLAAGGFVLRKKRMAVTAELEVARADHDAMMAQTTQLAQAVARVSEARGEANLVAYLRHPWSRARIVAAVVENWPESLVLEELKIQREGAQGGRPAVFTPLSPSPENQPLKPAAQADLAELRRDSEARPTVVLLSGFLTDQAVLHRFLAELSKIDLFSNVELLGMTPAEDGHSLKFHLRLSLPPGYGQTGGPSGPPPRRGTLSEERAGTIASESRPVIELPLVAPPAIAPPPIAPPSVVRQEDDAL
jgi:hypothetical protein